MAWPDLIGRTVTIHRRIPSQNHTQYRHWSAYTRERDAWFALLRAQLLPRPPVEQPVRMVIHSFRWRLIDHANLVGGAKAIPDCLVRLGYLRDDAPRWFACDYLQTQVPRADERTELTFLAWSADGQEPFDLPGAAHAG